MSKEQTTENTDKALHIADVIAMLPTEKEAEQYANGNFGYERGSSEQESAFVSGVDWMRCEIERKLKSN